MFRGAVRLYPNYWNHSTLHKRKLCKGSLFERNLYPFMRVQVEYDHILTHHSVFWLATINYHRTLVVHCWMIFSYADWYAFCFQNVDRLAIAVILHYLVCTFSYLPLSVEHEAATEHNDLALVLDGWMTLSALNNLLGTEGSLFPGNWIAHYLCFRYVFYWLIIHSSNHVHRLSDLSESRAFTRWRHPRLANWLSSYFSSETLSLLHSLNVALKTSCKFFS